MVDDNKSAADSYYGENDDYDSDLDLSFLKDDDEGAEKVKKAEK